MKDLYFYIILFLFLLNFILLFRLSNFTVRLAESIRDNLNSNPDKVNSKNQNSGLLDI
jgi:hypothetical protein